jgi:ubiquinone/menaquinone biosynthesis C-methylase UbiE
MTAQLSDSQIREFWTRQAQEHGQSPSASWSDHRVIEMEIREILKYLADGDRVLDVGCANGYSSFEYARARQIAIRGLDYIPGMIDEARRRHAKAGGDLRGRVEFAVDDITALREPTESYDKVIVVRVLINLGNWERQLQGLRESTRVLRPGGTLLLSEATLQGWERLNKLRAEWGLDNIPMPPFNQYLDETKVIAALSPDMALVTVSNFASTYYVGTRVLKPLLARASQFEVDVANPNAEWNRWCSQLPAAGDYGTQKLLVFQKL